MKLITIRLLATLRNIYYIILNFFSSLNIKKNQTIILFDSYNGSAFNDNPKAIFDYLIKSEYQLVWVFKDQVMIDKFNKEYPNYKAIKSHSFTHFRYLNKASVWIFNYKSPSYFKKPKDTKFLQTWHGIPLKKLGCDIKDLKQRFYRSKMSHQAMANSYIEEGKKLDYFITPSKYAKDALTSAFKLDTSKIIEVCYPRTYELDNQVKTKIKEELKIDRKVILYAPTWRDDSSSIKGYTFEYILDFSMFDEQFKQEYQILYRPHYLIKDKVDLSKYQDFVIDVSKYPEINDLYNISDLLISDYSSVYFDYAYFNKPIYFYMPDLSHYKDNLRDFYIDIDLDLPNDYTQTQTELIKQITSNYINKVKYDNFIKNNQLYESNLRLILDKLNI